MENFCKICQQPNPENSHYYSVHKITIEKYFRKYYPKKDLYDGSEIPWKGSADSYLLTDFSNRINLRKYLESLSIPAAKQFCKDLLLKRKELKNLVFSLSQVELKSIILPPMQYLDKIFNDEGGYYEVCKNLGFVNKFVRFDNVHVNVSTPENVSIIVDSREQSIPNLDCQIEVAKLPYGDYTTKNNNIFVERKSGSDIIGSFVGGYERICREFDRAEKDNAYIVVICENKIQDMLSFPYLPWFSRKIKVKPEFLFHNIRDCLQRYKFLQILFADGRRETARLIKKLLFNPELAKYDLEFLNQKGLL